MAAFYSLKPRTNNMYDNYDKLPREFYMKFDALTQQEFQGVKDNKITVAEALDNLQAKGQKLLTEEVEKAATAEPSPSTSSESGASVEVTTGGASAEVKVE